MGQSPLPQRVTLNVVRGRVVFFLSVTKPDTRSKVSTLLTPDPYAYRTCPGTLGDPCLGVRGLRASPKFDEGTNNPRSGVCTGLPTSPMSSRRTGQRCTLDE